ncbi:MAG TPA: hypothetical protein QGG47_15325 [Acidobacteriota bacterium]|nr:hypothetical protein [Acidobacteriota bacterium]
MIARVGRTSRHPRWGLLACTVAIASCAAEDRPPGPAETESRAPATKAVGSLVATVPGRAGPALVALEPRSAYDNEPPASAALIDQFGYTFEPPLSIAQQGQPVRFGNSEDVDHHVRVAHAETRAVVVNTNLLMDESVEHVFAEPGPYTVRCDIHPAMMAVILVLSHPYGAVTNNAGEFRIDGIPPGAYDLSGWDVAGEQFIELAVQVSKPADGIELELNPRE